MSLLKNKLKPNQPLIYERAAGVVYARYRDIPDIPRWIVGGDADAVAKAQDKIFDYQTWNEMMTVAETNTTLKKYLQKAVEIYYMIKETK